MTLDVFNYLSKNSSIYVKVNDSFSKKVGFLIKDKYKTLKNFNSTALKIKYATLKYEFQRAKYYPLTRLFKIAKFINLGEEEVFKNIKGFRASGSHRKIDIVLPRNIKVNENFVEGYALYLAEGDTGFSGTVSPVKLRFTNANIGIIRFFIKWLSANFPDVNFYLNVFLPPGIKPQVNFVHQIHNQLDLNVSQIKVKKGAYNKIIKYRLCCDSTILINLILLIEDTIKKLCLENQNLAAAYIRGMMMGEGTAYFNKSRYVRIEMKNEKEIHYLYSLFRILGYNCKPVLRSERENMWSIYIGAKQLKKFYDEIGFGVHRERQKILEGAVNKQLRVNQYV